MWTYAPEKGGESQMSNNTTNNKTTSPLWGPPNQSGYQYAKNWENDKLRTGLTYYYNKTQIAK